MRKFVKISSLVLILVIGTIGLAVAQNPSQPPPRDGFGGGMPGGGGPGGLRGEQLLAVMQDRLQLTAQQVEQVRAKLEEQAQQQQVLFQKYQGQRDQKTMETMRVEMQTLQEAFDQALKTILTQAQLADYNTMLQELQDPTEQTLAIWKVQLQLTEQQIEQLRTLLKQQNQQQQELFQKYPGQQDQKSRDAMQTEWQQLQKNFDAQLAKILTKAQLQAYQTMQQQQQRPPQPPQR